MEGIGWLDKRWRDNNSTEALFVRAILSRGEDKTTKIKRGVQCSKYLIARILGLFWSVSIEF